MHTRLFPAVSLAILCAACGGSSGIPFLEPPVQDTIRTITGRVAHHTTGPRLGNLDSNGRLIPQTGFGVSTSPAPAPRVPVEILGLDGTVMGSDLTGEDGRFEIQVNFGQDPATQIRVRTRAKIMLPNGASLQVKRNRTASEPYTHTSAPQGDPKERTMVADLTISLSGGAAAYRMVSLLHEGLLRAGAGIRIGILPGIDVFWEHGNGTVSSFDGSDPFRGEMTIAGGSDGVPSSNQDAWDEAKVMRLLGEYLLRYFLFVVAPEGTPNDALMVPSAAWREGFLDFWACIGRDTPIYWETEGIGPEGRVVRYFNLESFFDPALGSLGPDDPNVYQDPALVGISSRFTIAETLWDIHDSANGGDSDGIDFPLGLTLQFLDQQRPGFTYPYLMTLLEIYDADRSIDAVKIDRLLKWPEDQGISFIQDRNDGLVWPRWIAPNGLKGFPVNAPFQQTLSDAVDTVTPDPLNLEIGELTLRYFIFDLVTDADVTASLDTSGDLRIEILSMNNNLLAGGPSPVTASALVPLRYIVRVLPAEGADPQIAPFDLTVDFQRP